MPLVAIYFDSHLSIPLQFSEFQTFPAMNSAHSVFEFTAVPLLLQRAAPAWLLPFLTNETFMESQGTFCFLACPYRELNLLRFCCS